MFVKLKVLTLFLICCLGFVFPALGGSGCGHAVSDTTTTSTTSTTTTTDPRPTTFWNGRTITANETISNYQIYCLGSVTIESGGTLTLNNTKLVMSCEADEQYGIFVESGGAFNITNNSHITANNTNKGYYMFWFKEGSLATITNSTIEGTWTPNPAGKSQFNEAGIFFEADHLEITGSTIKNSKGNGLEYYQSPWGEDVIISSSTFNNNGANGLLIRNCKRINISNSTFNYNGTDHNRTDGCGIIFMGVPGIATIEGNTIHYNYKTGLELSGGYNLAKVFNNTVSHNIDHGIFLHDEYSLMSYAEVYNNTCEANGFNPSVDLEGVSVENSVEAYVHDNILINNNYGLRVMNNFSSTFESNLIQNNVNGVHIVSAAPIFYRNTIVGGNYGFLVQEQADPANPNLGKTSIAHSGYNNISNNTKGVAAQLRTGEVFAENNYWGYTTEAEINDYMFYFDFPADKVDFKPWLNVKP